MNRLAQVLELTGIGAVLVACYMTALPLFIGAVGVALILVGNALEGSKE